MSKKKHKTVQDIILHYEKNVTHVRPNTKKQVLYCSKYFVSKIGCDLSDNPSKVFTPKNVIKFQKLMLGSSQNSERTRAAISANSFLRMTKSLFSEHVVHIYRNLPKEVGEFKASKPLPARQAQYSVSDKRDAMRRIIERCEKLKNNKPDDYLCYFLMMHCGMRRKEAAFARWSWIGDNCITVREEEDFSTKSGRSRNIPLSDAQISFLRSRQKNRDHILPGAKTNRYRTIPDRIAKIIRKEGITGSKSAHELRKYYGANVATQLGLFEAQKYLGHSSPNITSQYYADLIEAKPVEVKIL
jgi:integrase